MSDFRAIIEIDISLPADGTTAEELEAMDPVQLLTLGTPMVSVEEVRRLMQLTGVGHIRPMGLIFEDDPISDREHELECRDWVDPYGDT